MIVKVPSDKDPNVQYEVNTVTGTCECPYYQRRLKEENAKNGTLLVCKHVVKARQDNP